MCVPSPFVHTPPTLQLVRCLVTHTLLVLSRLSSINIIHSDIKPENVLLSGESDFMTIDFGSASANPPPNSNHTYIQSRFYRSPEVLMSLSYDTAIDMWSLGMTAVEFGVGLPLFPGTNSRNMLKRIEETLGPFPAWMSELSPKADEFGVVRSGAWRVKDDKVSHTKATHVCEQRGADNNA